MSDNPTVPPPSPVRPPQNRSVILAAVACLAILAASAMISIYSWNRYRIFESDRAFAQARETSLAEREGVLRRAEERANIDRAERWNPKLYEFIAEHNANAIRLTDDRNTFTHDRRSAAINLARRNYPYSHVIDRGFATKTPATSRYAAAWHWGMANGMARIGEYRLAEEHYRRAVEHANHGFGPTADLTTNIRIDTILALHDAKNDAEAKKEVDRIDRHFAHEWSMRSSDDPESRAELAATWRRAITIAAVISNSDNDEWEMAIWRTMRQSTQPSLSTPDEGDSAAFVRIYGDAIAIAQSRRDEAAVTKIMQKQLPHVAAAPSKPVSGGRNRTQTLARLANQLLQKEPCPFEEIERILNEAIALNDQRPADALPAFAAYVELERKRNRLTDAISWAQKYRQHDPRTGRTTQRPVFFSPQELKALTIPGDLARCEFVVQEYFVSIHWLVRSTTDRKRVGEYLDQAIALIDSMESNGVQRGEIRILKGRYEATYRQLNDAAQWYRDALVIFRLLGNQRSDDAYLLALGEAIDFFSKNNFTTDAERWSAILAEEVKKRPPAKTP